MGAPFDDSPIPSGWARRIERLEQLVEVDPFGDRGESNTERSEAAFWERRYNEQHRTVHAMEDEIARLRAALVTAADGARAAVGGGFERYPRKQASS